MTKRTPNEIYDAVIQACGDALLDDEGIRIRDMLIGKLIWVECEPDGGWYRAAKTRLDILDTIPEPDYDGHELLGDSPKAMADEIRKCIEQQRPFNIETTDDYIEEKTGKRP
jgi:hypothetical protein